MKRLDREKLDCCIACGSATNTNTWALYEVRIVKEVDCHSRSTEPACIHMLCLPEYLSAHPDYLIRS